MKQICKRSLSLLGAAALGLALLAGCGGSGSSGAASTPDYPVIEAVDTTGMTLETADDGSVQVSYPAGEWTQNPDMGTLTILYTESMGTGQAISLNVQCAGDCPATLTDSDRETLMAQFEGQVGLSIDVSEMRLLHGQPVIYTETTMTMTDEYIDLALESGAFTQEMLDSIGGREALLNAEPTRQVNLYAVVNDKLFIYSGTYHTAEQKQLLVDGLTVIVPNSRTVG